jgi:O-antigen ligase
VSTALATKATPKAKPSPPLESFDTFLARNFRRWPLLLVPAVIFFLIRTTGARAGALMVIAASAFLLPLTVTQPDLGLYALVLNFVNEWDTYYKLQSYVPISLPLLFDVAIALGIWLTPLRRTADVGLEMVQIPLLLLYVALVTLSVLLSSVSVPNLWLSFRTGFLIRPAIFLFVIFIVREPKAIHRVLLTLIIAHVFLMATGLSDIVQKGSAALYRVRATVSAINYLSYVCIVTISILIALFVYMRDRLAKYALLVLSVVTIFVSLRTLSRSGYYSFPAPLLFLAARLMRSPRTLFAALAFGVLFYLMTPTGLSERLGQVESLTTTDRYYLSRIALRMALDYPLLGVGWQAYEKVFPAYDYEHVFRKAKAPHSLFLAIAARSGFPALAVYVALFGITFAQLVGVERAYHRAGRSNAFGCYLAIGLEAALVGHFVFGLAGSYGDSYYGFFALAMSFVLIRYHRRPQAAFLP